MVPRLHCHQFCLLRRQVSSETYLLRREREREREIWTYSCVCVYAGFNVHIKHTPTYSKVHTHTHTHMHICTHAVTCVFMQSWAHTLWECAHFFENAFLCTRCFTNICHMAVPLNCPPSCQRLHGIFFFYAIRLLVMLCIISSCYLTSHFY